MIDLGSIYTELDLGKKNRKAVSCSSAPAHSVPIAAKLTFWLTGLVAIEVGGQSSVVICGLAIDLLNIVS